MALETGAQFVIGIGGGSVLDAAKAIAVLATNGGDPMDYAEVIGKGLPLKKPALPIVAIPTTSGTGAEVTRNAVLSSPEHQVKVSLRSPTMLPCMAIVDPELTYDLPPSLTAETGLDALTQLIEPFVSSRANPMTDNFCLQGIRLAAQSLRRAFENGRDTAARENLSLASLLGGLSLANAGLGAVHGFAGPLGGITSAPHGAVCATLLPWVMETNIHALRERMPGSPALARFDEIGRILSGQPDAKAKDGIEWIHESCRLFGIKRLSKLGMKKSQFPSLIQSAQSASSMKANPLPLTSDELMRILELAW